jgi:aspartate racemase
MKKLLILGGLGPQASLLFHRRLLDAATARSIPEITEKIPLLLHLSVTLPHNTSNDDMSEPLRFITEEAKCLGDLAGFKAVMPCNTLHLFQQQIEGILGVPLISLAETVKQHVVRLKPARIGVLASPISSRNGLYAIPGVEVVAIDAKTLAKLDIAINTVIAGEDPAQFRPLVREAIASLQAQGCSHTILGCTELSVIMDGEPQQAIIDPLDLLVTRLIEENHV